MKTKFKIVKIAAITPPIAAIQRFPVSASLVDGSSPISYRSSSARMSYLP
jgi:hypothetical protein